MYVSLYGEAIAIRRGGLTPAYMPNSAGVAPFLLASRSVSASTDPQLITSYLRIAIGVTVICSHEIGQPHVMLPDSSYS